MAARRTAGLLLWRRGDGGADTRVEVLIAHMGGPYWSKREDGAWSVPKGEPDPGEDELAAAYREFGEEIGIPAPDGEPVPLGEAKQNNGKVAIVWALEADLDVSGFVSNTFEMEWPPRSGRMQSFPEMDRAEWVTVEDARVKLLPAQVTFLDRGPWVRN
ncbi:NUDIX domain-containing protein [Jatrophihabitans fulvus]